uniref:Uncharacterized protein n=1 Tax=Romanomermis culicivorax TaxID=13658 RepID=A0A915J5R4_ROMCU
MNLDIILTTDSHQNFQDANEQPIFNTIQITELTSQHRKKTKEGIIVQKILSCSWSRKRRRRKKNLPLNQKCIYFLDTHNKKEKG